MRQGQKARFARHLRRGMNDAARSLRHHLRNRAFIGHTFRRQHPVGPYMLDFASIEAQLAIELDGGQHAEVEMVGGRTRVLEARGYRVLRFWNNQVLGRQDAVLEAIFEALQIVAPCPTPPIEPGVTSANED